MRIIIHKKLNVPHDPDLYVSIYIRRVMFQMRSAYCIDSYSKRFPRQVRNASIQLFKPLRGFTCLEQHHRATNDVL